MTTHIANTNAQYEQRQIVARLDRLGSINMNLQQYPIWSYLTFHGGGMPAFAATFDRLAPRDRENFLLLDDLRPGELVVTPGLVYRKIPMTGMLLMAHLDAMKYWRPKQTTSYEMDLSGVVDVGTIDLSGEVKQ